MIPFNQHFGKWIFMFATLIGVLEHCIFSTATLMYVLAAAVAGYLALVHLIRKMLGDRILSDQPSHASPLSHGGIPRDCHDKRRAATYPSSHFNTWYHLCDADELDNNKVVEARCLNLTLAVWRGKDGKPVCQSAFCLHLGANLAVGGKVVDGCIQCPFHRWSFNEDGSISEIPYINDPKCVPQNKSLKTYPCVEFCGFIYFYYHADDKAPEFELPAFIAREIKEQGFAPHLKWNLGYHEISPVDWVDQAGDHAHFHTLHSDFRVPWTNIELPEWFKKYVPLGIIHNLTTYRGDDQEWASLVQKKSWGCVDKHIIFFTDKAGLTWNGKAMENTFAETMELYVGPALMIFNIPFTIGAFKVFVSMTPVEQGTVMKVRTFIDKRSVDSMFVRAVAWILQGISASQLDADLIIMKNKIRLKRPILQPFDGPYNRVNSWMKQFYSPGKEVHKVDIDAYKNDW